jgi:hypothetical protein
MRELGVWQHFSDQFEPTVQIKMTFPYFSDLSDTVCVGRWLIPLKFGQPGFEFVESLEVVGREYLWLYDGEVDLDLVEPGGVLGQVDETQGGPARLQAVDGGSSAAG